MTVSAAAPSIVRFAAAGMLVALLACLPLLLFATTSAQAQAAEQTHTPALEEARDVFDPAQDPFGLQPDEQNQLQKPPAESERFTSVPVPAAAVALEPLRLDLDAERGSWMLSADLDVPWSPALEDAVRRGVALYFVLEFQLLQPRWWWTDRMVVQRSNVTRLAWHALTRQYRVTADGLTQTWDTLSDALDTMRKVRHWRVFDAASVAAGSTYVARIRLRLDTSQLPKPLQLNAMTDRDWNPPAEWRRTNFQP